MTQLQSLILFLFLIGLLHGTTPPPSAIKTLQEHIKGKVILKRSNPIDYNITTHIDNPAYDSIQPAIVVWPVDAADVATSVTFAKKWNMPFSVKSGGHSASGYCLIANGLTLDMRLMTSVKSDLTASTVELGPGARWSHVYNTMYNRHGPAWVVTGGFCPNVAVGGYVQGGGMSVLSRDFGLAIDNMLEMDVVTADGNMHKLHADSAGKEADLWWALRGGGGGNFGVITRVKMAIQKLSHPQLLYGGVCYNRTAMIQALAYYNDFASSLPNTMDAYGITRYDKEFGHLNFCITLLHHGDPDIGYKYATQLIDATTPNNIDLSLQSIHEMESHDNSTEIDGIGAYIKSGMMRKDGLISAVQRIIVEFMDKCPNKVTFLLWDHVGGQINTVAWNATAYPWRDIEYVFEVKAIWRTPAEKPVITKWANELWAALDPYFHGYYINYIDYTVPLEKYYAGNWNRLKRIKKEWDPTNFFKFNQSIPLE